MDNNFPPQEPSVIVKSPGLRNRKITRVGAVLILLALLILGFYFFQGKFGNNKYDLSDTKRGGEKSYVNSSSKYSLSYDSNNFRAGADIGKNDKASYFQYCPTSMLDTCTSEPKNIVQIYTLDNPLKQTLSEWIKSNASSPVYVEGKMLCYLNDSRTQIKLNDKFKEENAITYRFTVDEKTAKVCPDQELELAGEFKYIFVSKNDKVYWFSMTQATEQTLPILEKFLDGFKFE